MKKVLLKSVDLTWMFNWMMPDFIRGMWGPIPELWTLFLIVLNTTILNYALLIGGEIKNKIDTKHQIDLSIVMGIDLALGTDLNVRYIEMFYSHMYPKFDPLPALPVEIEDDPGLINSEAR